MHRHGPAGSIHHKAGGNGANGSANSLLDIRFLSPSFLSSSSDRPDMKEIYIGISGSIHGDTKETSPAAKAAKKDVLSIPWSPGYQCLLTILSISESKKRLQSPKKELQRNTLPL